MSVQVLDLFTCCVAPARQEAIGSRPKITRAMIGDPITDTFQHLTHVGAGDDYSAVRTVGPAKKSAGPTPNFQSRFTNLQPLPNVQQNSVASSQLSPPNTTLQDHNSSIYREADGSGDPRFQISSHHHSTSQNAPATNSKLHTQSDTLYPPDTAVDSRQWRNSYGSQSILSGTMLPTSPYANWRSEKTRAHATNNRQFLVHE